RSSGRRSPPAHAHGQRAEQRARHARAAARLYRGRRDVPPALASPSGSQPKLHRLPFPTGLRVWSTCRSPFAAFVETDIGALRHLNFVAEQYSVISLRKRPAVRSGEEAGRARKFPSACQRVRKSMIDIAMNGLILLDRGDDVAEMGVSREIPVGDS